METLKYILRFDFLEHEFFSFVDPLSDKVLKKMLIISLILSILGFIIVQLSYYKYIPSVFMESNKIEKKEKRKLLPLAV